MTKHQILKIVATYLNVNKSAIIGVSQKREYCDARHIFCLLCRKYTSESLKAIGEYLSGRDHTTVIHSISAIKDMMFTDPKFKRMVAEMEIIIEMSGKMCNRTRIRS